MGRLRDCTHLRILAGPQRHQRNEGLIPRIPIDGAKASKATAFEGTLTGIPFHSVINANDCSCRKATATLEHACGSSVDTDESSNWLTIRMVGGGIDHIVANDIFGGPITSSSTTPLINLAQGPALVYYLCYRVNVFMQCRDEPSCRPSYPIHQPT